MAFEISSISHLGVEVAPHTPIEEAPVRRELFISSALSIKWELGLTFLAFAEQHFPIGTFSCHLRRIPDRAKRQISVCSEYDWLLAGRWYRNIRM